MLLGLTSVDRARLRAATWLTVLFACYGVIDFSVHNGLVAFGVSGGLALLWLATGHDRELVHLADLGPRRRPRPGPVRLEGRVATESADVDADAAARDAPARRSA